MLWYTIAVDGNRRRITLRDLAGAAGVSLAQASHALAGYADVSPQTRERVQRLARELGYRPSSRARSLKAGRQSQQRCGLVLVGMSAPAFSRTYFYGPALAGLMAQAAAEHMDIHLIPLPATDIHSAGGIAAALARLVAEDRADGYVLMAFVPLAEQDVEPFKEVNIPFVLANRHFGTRSVNAVTVDYASGVESAVEHLTSIGHRRLALLLPEGARSTLQDREWGWRKGIEHAGLPADHAPVLRYSVEDEHGGQMLTAALLAASTDMRPTALVCHSDICAHGALLAAAAAGVRIPEEISVIGFDNIVARFFTPSLCTFESHPHQLGARVASLLAQTLRGEIAAPQHERIRPEFVCRGSGGSCSPRPKQFRDK